MLLSLLFALAEYHVELNWHIEIWRSECSILCIILTAKITHPLTHFKVVLFSHIIPFKNAAFYHWKKKKLLISTTFFSIVGIIYSGWQFLFHSFANISASEFYFCKYIRAEYELDPATKRSGSINRMNELMRWHVSPYVGFLYSPPVYACVRR